MSDLIEFLKARLDEDEKGANTWLLFVAEAKRIEARDRRRTRNPASRWTLEEEARAKRTLAEAAAKRAIIDLHAPMGEAGWQANACKVCSWGGESCGCLGPLDGWPCETVKRTAEVYRDHPEWREEWAA